MLFILVKKKIKLSFYGMNRIVPTEVPTIHEPQLEE